VGRGRPGGKLLTLLVPVTLQATLSFPCFPSWKAHLHGGAPIRAAMATLGGTRLQRGVVAVIVAAVAVVAIVLGSTTPVGGTSLSIVFHDGTPGPIARGLNGRLSPIGQPAPFLPGTSTLLPICGTFLGTSCCVSVCRSNEDGTEMEIASWGAPASGDQLNIPVESSDCPLAFGRASVDFGGKSVVGNSHFQRYVSVYARSAASLPACAASGVTWVVGADSSGQLLIAATPGAGSAPPPSSDESSPSAELPTDGTITVEGPNDGESEEGTTLGTPVGNGECFPAAAPVRLSDGRTVAVADVARGDLAAVTHTVASDVYAWSHRSPGGDHPYVALSTTGGGVLEASSGHLVYVASDGHGGDKHGSRLVPAGDITPGMHLVTADGTADRVVAVAGVVRAGKYAPHTLHGDLVVAGFRVSSYTTAMHPVVAHALLAPARAAYAVGWDLLGGWLDEGAPWVA